MGVYQYTDPQTGRSYNFNIAGEAPSNDDFAKIQQYLDGERGEYAQKYQDVFGREFEAPDDGSAIGRGFERGKKQIKQAFGETLGTIGEETGLGFLANYGQGLEQRAQQELGQLMLEQPERMTSEDVTGVGSALTYAGELIGEQVPQLGLGLGAAVAAPVVAGATGLGAFGLGALAAGATTAPILFGNNIQRQEDEVAQGKKESVDIGAALTATFGQATLEGISDRLLLGGVLRPLGASLFTRTATRAAGGGTTEALTEVGQQMMERAQAGLPIDSDDAIDEYREAAIAGGLVGGGVRATGIGERGPETPPAQEVEAPEAVAAPAPVQAPEAAPVQAPEAAAVTPEVEAAAEAVAAQTTSPALEREAQNAVDPTPPAGAAEQTQEQRAAESAVVAAEAATPSVAQVTEEAKVAQQAQLAPEDQKAVKKTKEVLAQSAPEAAPQPSGTAAIESETSGQDIQVKGTKPAETVEAASQAQVIDDAFLANLNVPKQALIRREGTKKSLIGKKVSDEGVLDELRNYANISSIPEARDGVQGFLDTLEVSDAGVEPEPTRTGVSVPSSERRVVGSRGAARDVGDTTGVTPPDTGPVGSGVPTPSGTAIPAGLQPGTLEAAPEVVQEPVQEAEVTPDERGIAAVQQLAEQATATPVEIAPQPQAQPAPQPAVQAPATPAMQQAAIGGAETGLAGQVIPGVARFKDSDRIISAPQERFAPQPAPEMQAAPVPQEQLQAVEAERDAAAQAQIDRSFESNRGKQPQVREYHDTQVDPRSAPEVTTAVDKEGIVELLNTTDKELDAQGKAAKLYFKRFRRPVDALAEMGAVSAVGPTQSIEADYTPAEFAFYKGMTQKSAMDARKWVFSNLSRQAFVETRDASVRARRDTTKYNPSDAYIAVTKAAKSIQRKDDRAFKRQMDREIDALKLEAETRAPAAPDQEMRGTEGRIGTFTPIKGQTAFESYLLDLGFKFRKPTKKQDVPTVSPVGSQQVIDPETNKPLTQQEIFDFYDGFAYTKNELGFLLADPVHGLDQTLLPSIQNALQRGDLQFAVDAIASTSQVDRIREIAGKLGAVIGDTQVQVVDDLSAMIGRKAAGMFEPETNTIFIDANNGMNVHTILHEMTHAATSASLANPSLPEVKQLQTLFNAVREQFGEVYGTANMDEFVAEAFSNPEFQSALALLRVDGGKMSGWEKFTGAVKRVVRKLLGLSPSPTALTEVDRLIDGMLAPSPATRAAPSMMLMARAKEGAANLINNYTTAVPKGDRNTYEQLRDVALANTPRSVRNVVLSLQPVNNLVRIAKDRIPFAPELNVLIDEMSGAFRKVLEPVDVVYEDYKKFRKQNRKAYDSMLGLMNRATQEEVDPARPRDTYTQYWMSYYDKKTEKTVTRAFKKEQDRNAEIAKLNAALKADEAAGKALTRTKAKKAGDADADKAKMWDVLNKEYQALGKEGQRLYKVTRNMGEGAIDRILPAIEARVGAMGVDGATKKAAFEKLADLLHAESGIIRPYFKLTRDGEFRLQYAAPDPLTGNDEVFTERYDSERKLLQAQANVAKYLGEIDRGDLKSQIQAGRDEGKRDYSKAPSSSFVFELLKTLQITGADQQTIDRVIDLALDAIPERSFMQSFRSRKERASGGRGVFGALGDVTPSGMPGMDADPAELFRSNFRGIEKQLVQLEYGAKIQQFRNKLVDGGYFSRLDTDVMARKLDQVASFAQSPSMAKWSQVATSMGFGFTMGANVSSAAITLFDVPMSVFPYMSGEYGIRKTTNAISDGVKAFMGSPDYKTVTVMGEDGQPVKRIVKMGKYGKSLANYDYDDPNLPPAVKRYKALVERGTARAQFNQTMTQEQLDISGNRDTLETINKFSSFFFHHTERFGREAALIAAYDLELNKRSDNGKKALTDADYAAAADKAIDTVELTLGGTASAGRPTWAQTPVGNVVYLFKRFAVQRYYYMAHLADKALAGADPETRKIARSQLAQLLAISGALAGVGGMPMMGAIGAIYDMFSDDEEDSFEAMMRKTIGEGFYSGLGNAILGVDVASRVSMNSLLYRAPIVEKDQDRLWTMVEQLGGPVLGTYLSISRGTNLMMDGEVQRGLEAMLPAAARNALKSVRFYSEGANTLRGDPITDDINPYNTFMQFLGFAPADYIENLETNKNERRKKNSVDTKRRKLMRQYNMARRNNNTEGVQDALRKIEEFNNSLPDNFRVEGRIDSSDLKKSYAGFMRTTGNMVNGIVYSDAMRKSLEDYE